MALKKITSADTSGKGVTGLPDTPGLSATDLQKKFDELSLDVIIPAINENIDELNGSYKEELTNEVETKIVEDIINDDNPTVSTTYSSSKLEARLREIGGVTINDDVASYDSVYSSSKVENTFANHSDLTSKVNKSGDTMTGDLVLKDRLVVNDGVNNRSVLSVYDDGDDLDYGSEIVFSGSGNSFIGSGESTAGLRTALQNATAEELSEKGEAYGVTGERLFLVSDSAIYFYPNTSNDGNTRAGYVLYNAGFAPNKPGSSMGLGTSARHWASAYIDDIRGALTGKFTPLQGKYVIDERGDVIHQSTMAEYFSIKNSNGQSVFDVNLENGYVSAKNASIEGNLEIYDTSTYKTATFSASLTANRAISIPDKAGTLAMTSDIPTKVSQLTNDSGFTANAGTITGIKMNGASKGTSGVVDLGTVITSHQDISGKLDLAGGTMTGKILLANQADSLETSGAGGFIMDQYGNLKHKRATNTDTFALKKSDGTNALTYNWETGEITLTNNLKFNITFDASSVASGNDLYPFKVYGGNKNGNGISVGSGAAVIVGAGESANACQSLLAATTEQLWLTSDSEIHLYSNCNTIANKIGITMSSAGNFYPDGNSQSLGTSGHNWSDVYATTFHGTLDGDASTVNGHTVAIDVPSNAKFTDTTYSNATTSAAGLMSATDKSKLDDCAGVKSLGSTKSGTPLSFKSSTTGRWLIVANSSRANGNAMYMLYITTSTAVLVAVKTGSELTFAQSSGTVTVTNSNSTVSYIYAMPLNGVALSTLTKV